MGRISTGIGLVSNINYKDIIDQLMTLESQPKDKLQERIDQTNERKLAYADLSTRLTGLKLTATTLKKPSTFQAASATSGDENVLTATASNGASVGNYQFQVARLVTTQQAVSSGFADFDSTRVGAGTLTLEQGGGGLFTRTPLSQLNGGAGVRRGQFRITDRSGASAVIDVSSAVTLDDVVKQVNNSLGVTVRATVSGDRLILTDLSAKSTNNFSVTDLGDGHAAADLGIVANEASGTIAGGDINYLGPKSMLDALNDGRGVRRASDGGTDFRVTARDGTSFEVNLAAARTVGDVMDAINNAAGGKVRADVVPGANGLLLSDTSGGTGALSVAAVNGSGAAADLGIATSVNAATLNGQTVLAGLNTVLVSSLRGGAGLPLGRITITDRAGATATVDLSGAKNVQDVLDRISNATGVGVTASLKASGNGIQITDDTGDTGNLVIGDVNSTTAAALGVAGTFGTSVAAVQGANLQRQWVSENTLLADYNGGKGVTPGRFKVTNSRGITTTIDLTAPGTIKLGQVIAKINQAGIGVAASINANGDGLLLTDSAGGAGKLKVEDVEATTAKDLNISGEATGTSIDGSFEKTVAVDATDTLATVQQKITALGFGVSASIINDGTGLAPYRLSLTAKNGGRDGRVVIDGGATSLQTRNLVEAQDAAVFLGSADAPEPLLITAGQNQVTGVIKGVTIELHGVSNKPVTLGVTRTADAVVEQLSKFAEDFNALADKLKEVTKFDTDTKQRGVLLGDSSVQTVETLSYSMFTGVVPTAGRYRVLADVGLKLVDGGKMEFDEDKFRQAYAADPDSVERLFSASETVTEGNPPKDTIRGLGVGWMMEGSFTRLIDPVDGVITRENKTLDQKTAQFQDRIDSLDKLLGQKRTRLERQFAQLESVLANLQSQQTALNSFQPVAASSNK